MSGRVAKWHLYEGSRVCALSVFLLWASPQATRQTSLDLASPPSSETSSSRLKLRLSGLRYKKWNLLHLAPETLAWAPGTEAALRAAKSQPLPWRPPHTAQLGCHRAPPPSPEATMAIQYESYLLSITTLFANQEKILDIICTLEKYKGLKRVGVKWGKKRGKEFWLRRISGKCAIS